MGTSVFTSAMRCQLALPLEISIPKSRFESRCHSGVQRFLDAGDQTRFFDARGWTNPQFISGRKSTFSDKLNFAIFPKKTFDSPTKISDDLFKKFAKNVGVVNPVAEILDSSRKKFLFS